MTRPEMVKFLRELVANEYMDLSPVTKAKLLKCADELERADLWRDMSEAPKDGKLIVTRQERLWKVTQHLEALYNEDPHAGLSLPVLAVEGVYRKEFGDYVPGGRPKTKEDA